MERAHFVSLADENGEPITLTVLSLGLAITLRADQSTIREEVRDLAAALVGCHHRGLEARWDLRRVAPRHPRHVDPASVRFANSPELVGPPGFAGCSNSSLAARSHRAFQR